MASHKPNRKNGAALPFRACPTFSDHVAVAGGQKEIDNTYGAPERKRHSHEHDNEDRNFPPGYTFHFSARIEPISPLHLNSKYFAAKRAKRPSAAIANPAAKAGIFSGRPTQGRSRSHRRQQDRSSDKSQAQEKAPDNAGA
jgi:hypothetical protein